MPMQPALRKALAFLSGQVDILTGQPCAQLPPVRLLALRAGVSYRTMWLALKKCYTAGVLVSHHGKGITLGTGSPTSLIASDDGFLSGGPTERQLTFDILSGVYASGERIPSYKDLQARYGSLYPALRRSTESLCVKGFLRRQGNSFHVAHLRASSSALALVVVVPRRRGEDRIWQEVGISTDAVRGCEAVGSSRSLRVQFLSYDPDDSRLHDLSLPHRPPVTIDRSMCLGILYIHDHTVVDPSNSVNVLLTLHTQLAVVDCTGQAGIALKDGVRSRVLFSDSIVNQRPGMDCGRYLRELGHTEAAFFSMNGSLQWSKNRYAGLSSCFSGVSAYTRETTTADFITPVRKAFGDHHTYLPSLYHADADRELRESSRRIGSFASVRVLAEPLFQDALEHSTATAWVAANDFVCGFAVEFLRSRNIKVPHQISVIGFDDDFTALRDNISSYNHNIGQIISTIVNLMINTSPSLRKKQDLLNGLGGRIVARGTTGPVRGRR